MVLSRCLYLLCLVSKIILNLLLCLVGCPEARTDTQTLSVQVNRYICVIELLLQRKRALINNSIIWHPFPDFVRFVEMFEIFSGFPIHYTNCFNYSMSKVRNAGRRWSNTAMRSLDSA